MTHPDSNIAASRHPGSAHDAGYPPLHALVLALTAGHAMASTALVVLPVVAPAVASDYGISAALIGYQFGIIGTAQLTTLLLVGNLSRKLGACRTNQLGHIAVTIGLLLMLLPWPVFLVPGSLGIGLGFGLLGPSQSALLTRFAPAAQRNLVFSIQQTSVPIGGIFAALAGPYIAVTFGWRWMLVCNACLLLLTIALLQRGRARWDDDRVPAARTLTVNPFAGMVASWRDRRVRLLSVAGGALCWAQFCVAAYTVVTCVEVLGMSLIVAGTVLVVVQLCNALGRLAAGWLADWIHSAARVLGWLAWIMLATCIALVWLAPAWPTPLVYLVFSLLGITSGAWPGILMAEVGHLAPRSQLSTVISGMLIYVNIGKMLGPAIFAVSYALTGSYGVAFGLVGVPALLAIYCLTAVQREPA